MMSTAINHPLFHNRLMEFTFYSRPRTSPFFCCFSLFVLPFYFNGILYDNHLSFSAKLATSRKASFFLPFPEKEKTE